MNSALLNDLLEKGADFITNWTKNYKVMHATLFQSWTNIFRKQESFTLLQMGHELLESGAGILLQSGVIFITE